MRDLSHNQAPRFSRRAKVTAAVAGAALAGGLIGGVIGRATGGSGETRLSPAAAAATGKHTGDMARVALKAGRNLAAQEHQRTVRAAEHEQQLAKVDAKVNAFGLSTAKKMLGMVRSVMGSKNTDDFFPTDEPALGIEYAGKHRMAMINVGYQGDGQVVLEASTSEVANPHSPIDDHFSMILKVDKQAGDELTYIGKHRNPTAADFLDSLKDGAQVVSIATMPSDTPATGHSINLNTSGHYSSYTETLQTPGGKDTYDVAIGPQITSPSSLAPVTGYVGQSVLHISAALHEPAYYTTGTYS